MGIKNHKNGWTLAEVVLSLVILGLLMLVSINAIRPKKPANTPFAYAALRNLQRVANFVIEDMPDQRRLPEGAIKPTTGEGVSKQVELCYRMADILSLIGNPTCTATWYNPEEAHEPVMNFQATNLVAYYGLEGPFLAYATDDDNLTYRKQALQEYDNPEHPCCTGNAAVDPADCIECNFTYTGPTLKRGLATLDNRCGKTDVKVKEILIDINGTQPNGASADVRRKNPDRIGVDRFPVKIYNTGEVIPGTCVRIQEAGPEDANEPTEELSKYEDAEIPTGVCSGTYTIDSPIFASPYCGDNQTTNFMITNVPFAYNVYSLRMPTKDEVDAGADPNQRITTLILKEVSFAEADCRARYNILTRGQCKALEYEFNKNRGTKDKGTCQGSTRAGCYLSFDPMDDFEQTVNKTEDRTTITNTGAKCTGENNFCIIRQAKPVSMGFMGLSF